MPKIKYRACFQQKSKKRTFNIVSKGATSARAIMRANVLLAADENKPDYRKNESEIAKFFYMNRKTAHNIQKQY